MSSLFRKVSQRQEHIGYFAICFILLAFAVAFARQAGWPVALGLWLICMVILELIYRWVFALGIRNRKRWWAKPRGHRFWRGFRLIVYGIAATIGLVMRPRALGFVWPALLSAGLLCAGILLLLVERRRPS
ncbi:MAG TPA: hypothetical protein VFR84_13720 [Candidatus Angelobacter sp.]|nr:hypothetical protein [Candidatus Angelobacter sp.]